jgi:3-octaprenyl-4-hydroxybenzoate carboxy-lyase
VSAEQLISCTAEQQRGSGIDVRTCMTRPSTWWLRTVRVGGPDMGDKAAVVSRDPDAPDDFGKQNVGVYRMEVNGPRRLGLQPAVPQHDVALHLTRAEERGEDLPVAIAIGNDPVISIVAGTALGYDQSEYELAGALTQRGGCGRSSNAPPRQPRIRSAPALPT